MAPQGRMRLNSKITDSGPGPAVASAAMLKLHTERLAQARAGALRGHALPLAPKLAVHLWNGRPAQAYRARRREPTVAVASRPQKAREQPQVGCLKIDLLLGCAKADISWSPQVAVLQEDPTPFFEPLLRSFILGLGAGALFETLHVATKACGFCFFSGSLVVIGNHVLRSALFLSVNAGNEALLLYMMF